MAFSKIHLANVTAKDRAKSFPTEFYEDHGILMCYSCEKAIDHKRLSTVKDHLGSTKHLEQAKKRQALTDANEGSSKKLRQCTILSAVKTSQTAKETRDEVVGDFVCALVAANIPIHKADNPVLRSFLQKHVRNGGSIPQSQMLRDKVPSVYSRHINRLMNIFIDQPIFVIIDETTDNRSKQVVNILFVTCVKSDKSPIKPYLVETCVVDKTNTATIGGAVLRTLAQYNIFYHNVLGFVTDGARYMKSTFTKVIQPVCEKCIHIICIAHCLNLVGEVLRASVPDVDLFVQYTKKAFRLSSAKRQLYVRLLSEAGIEDPTPPPAPVITRWYSWLEAVVHYHKYFKHYPEMMHKVQEEFGDGAGVAHIIKMLDEDARFKELDITIRCVSIFGHHIIDSIKQAESQSVASYKIYNQVSHLRGQLRAAAEEDWGVHLRREGFNNTDAQSLKKKLQKAMLAIADKCDQFLNCTESSWKFLKEIRVLDPSQLPALSLNINNYSSIPEFATPSLQLSGEWNSYVKSVQDMHDEKIDDVLAYWHGMAAQVPNLASIAMNYLSMPVNSVDAERSFSVYNNVITDKRHNLSDENTKMFVGLYYNATVSEGNLTELL